MANFCRFYFGCMRFELSTLSRIWFSLSRDIVGWTLDVYDVDSDVLVQYNTQLHKVIEFSNFFVVPR